MVGRRWLLGGKIFGSPLGKVAKEADDVVEVASGLAGSKSARDIVEEAAEAATDAANKTVSPSELVSRQGPQRCPAAK
jgi:hypothetical protein